MSYFVYTRDMTTPKEQLGILLRKARKVRGLRQKDVAEELGVNIKQVGRWERGENASSSILLMRMLRLFREHADTPDLQDLVEAIEHQPPPDDLGVRLLELQHRLKEEPWLVNRLERLLELTTEEFDDAMGYADKRKRQKSRGQSIP